MKDFPLLLGCRHLLALLTEHQPQISLCWGAFTVRPRGGEDAELRENCSQINETGARPNLVLILIFL